MVTWEAVKAFVVADVVEQIMAESEAKAVVVADAEPTGV